MFDIDQELFINAINSEAIFEFFQIPSTENLIKKTELLSINNVVSFFFTVLQISPWKAQFFEHNKSIALFLGWSLIT